MSLSILAQNQVTISVTNPETYDRISDANLLIEDANGKLLLYKTDRKGLVAVNDLQGKIKISSYKKGYEVLQAEFEVDEDLRLQFLLSPEEVLISDEKSEYLIEAKLRNSHSGDVLNNTQLEIGKHKFSSNKEGYIRVPLDLFENSKLEEGDSIQYHISSPGFETISDYYFFAPAQQMYMNDELIPLRKALTPNSEPIEDEESINRINRIVYESLNQTRAVSCSGLLPRTSIRVGYNCSCNSCSNVTVMSLEYYTQSGLDNEWISSWRSASLKAGSVAYRSYGAYHILHPIRNNYDISNTTCRQVWRSNVYTSTRNAAIATSGKLLVRNNSLAFTEYSAENNNSGCGNGYAGVGTSTAPCISDNLCRNRPRYGHGRGMCQWGSQRWAVNGKSYTWILNHYYNPAGIYLCGGSSNVTRPDLVIQSLWTSPTYPCRGNYTRLYVTVKNIGNGSSNAVPYRRTINGQTAFTGTIPALSPGGSITYYRTYVFYQSGYNSYCVYVNGANNELNTNNNSYCINKYVYNCRGMDLDLNLTSTHELNGIAGQDIEIPADTWLEGDGSELLSDAIHLNYYLSTDTTLDKDDRLIGEEIRPILETKDQEEVKVQTIYLPTDIKEGDYNMIIESKINASDSENHNLQTTVNVKIRIDNSLMNGEELQTQVQLSPNPTSGNLLVRYEENQSVSSIEIYDINGYLVKTISTKNPKEIDISQLKPGTYMFKVFNDKNESALIKIIKR